MKKILKRLSVAKKKMGKWFWVLAAVPLLAILAFILTRGNKPSGISVVVQKGPVVEELVLSGQVKAVRHAILYFPTSGKISWRNISR